MHRLLILALLLAASGCADFRKLFTSRANVAAEAGDQELPAARLAALMRGAGGTPINQETAEFVANVWVDYALFAEAAAEGKLLVDSATVSAAMWPEIAEARTSRWHDLLASRRPPVGEGAADSIYGGQEVRVFQHILFSTPAGAPPAAKAGARKQAERAVSQIKRGSDFGDLAGKLSQDPGSARDAGFLPPSPRGAFVPAFDSAGWNLAPGEVSGIVETQFGFHVIKRPSKDAVRDRLFAWVTQNASGRLDSIYMDSLARRSKLEINSGAAGEMREALEDLDGARDSRKRIVRFEGGGLSVGDYVRWVRALPPPYRAQLKQANDTALTQFARVLASNVLLLRQADSAKVQLTTEEWETMQRRFAGQIDSLRSEMQLPADSTATVDDRELLATRQLDQYFDLLLGGKLRIRPLPSTLGAVLRERSDYQVNEAGVRRAVEIAQAEGKADGAGGGGPGGGGATKDDGMQRAPGPAPVPGGAPPSPVPEVTPAPTPGGSGASGDSAAGK